MNKLYSLGVPIASFMLAVGVSAFSTSMLMGNSGQKKYDAKGTGFAPAMVPELVKLQAQDFENSALPSISVGKYEVTIAQYYACVDDGACKYQPRRSAYKEDDHPVTDVSWLDATTYVRWLSVKTGDTYRLPLSSEWQVFAGDLLQDKSKKLFDDPRMAWAADYANYGVRPSKKTHSAANYQSNNYGIHGIDGNVWEWTDTCWRKDDLRGLAVAESKNCGGVRILQGLHKTNQSEFIRSVKAGGCSIGFAPSNIGFRVVRENSKNLTQLVTR